MPRLPSVRQARIGDVVTTPRPRPTKAKPRGKALPRYVETQASVSAWARDTFGVATTNARVAARANEEMAELLRALTVNDFNPDAPDEIADVVIVLYRLAERMDVDLHDLIDRKMKVNRARKWSVGPDGCGKHVREVRPAPRRSSR